MAKIIVFGNQKGGVGKSTLTLLAATALSQKPFNYKVIVIDADQQRSLRDARKYDLEADPDNKPSYEIEVHNSKDLTKVLPKLDKKYDLIFVDVPGKMDVELPIEQQEIAPILMNTDLLIIPMIAGNFGIDATLNYLQIVFKIAKVKRKKARPLQVVGMINQHVRRLLDDKYLIETAQDIASRTGLRFFMNNLGLYSLYRSADSLESIYNAKSMKTDLLNFRRWINELNQIIKNG